MARGSLGAWLLFSSLCVAVAVACGSGGNNSGFHPGPGDDSGTGPVDGSSGGEGMSIFGDGSLDGSFSSISSLYFSPAATSLALDGTNSKSASFTLFAKYADGHTAQVSAQSLQFDRPDLATMTVGEPVVLKASGPYAGVGTLHAIYAGQSATAQLTVQMNIAVVGTGVPTGAITALGGANLPQDPGISSILYPYDKTVFALGLTSPLVMWNAPNPSGDVYRLHYTQKNYSYDGYFLVAAPAQISADQLNWDRLTASNGGDPLVLTLSRWDAAAMKAYTSATESWTVAPASLQGAIYYWTTSGTGHMSRIQPGTGAMPQILNNGTCMGCHAVSADGSTLVAAVEGEGSTDSTDARAWVSYDLPSMTIRKEPHLFGGNVSVTPDGKYTVFGTAPMHLGDTTTGAEIPNSGIETFPLDPGYTTLAHPVFAPDGKYFAALESNSIWHEWTVGQLVLWNYSETAQTFTTPTKLANGATFPAGQQAVAYPTFSPDSKWLAFHVADYAGGCHDACNATTVDTGAIWLQSVAGAAPVRQTVLTDSSPSAADHDISFEPTFNPVPRGGYFWVVFTSMRNWGNRVTGPADCGQKRLWVAAIDATPGATDASHPAFFLQGQEETTMNMRGYWALAACTPTKGGGGCTQGFQCCSGFCDMGKCVDTGTTSCMGLGGSCKTTADCCNMGLVQCVGGKCATQSQ
jgi:hypothetical protein